GGRGRGVGRPGGRAPPPSVRPATRPRRGRPGCTSRPVGAGAPRPDGPRGGPGRRRRRRGGGAGRRRAGDRQRRPGPPTGGARAPAPAPPVRPTVRYTASAPSSPVRIRTRRDTSVTHTLPSPIFPVRAAPEIVSTTESADTSSTTTSTF